MIAIGCAKLLGLEPVSVEPCSCPIPSTPLRQLLSDLVEIGAGIEFGVAVTKTFLG